MLSNNVETTIYKDKDGDGYGDPKKPKKLKDGNPIPDDYSYDNTDCNDDVATTHPLATEICDGEDNDCDGQVDEGIKTKYYPDMDGDQYLNRGVSPFETCNNAPPPSGYVKDNTNYTDCDDANPSVNGITLVFKDADGDGFGDTNISELSCPRPGYVENDTDCNDNDATIWREAWVRTDGDGDGYTSGVLHPICYGSSFPTGVTTTTNGADCDDSDATLWHQAWVRTDADGDGYTSGVLHAICYGSSFPTGVTTTTKGADCDDSDATLWHQAWVRTDADGDGYTSGVLHPICYGSSFPTGVTTTTKGADCDDSDATLWHEAWVRTDADGDG